MTQGLRAFIAFPGDPRLGPTSNTNSSQPSVSPVPGALTSTPSSDLQGNPHTCGTHVCTYTHVKINIISNLVRWT